jgi:hypothetical protein
MHTTSLSENKVRDDSEHRHRREDNIEMNSREVGCEGVWTELAQDRMQ